MPDQDPLLFALGTTRDYGQRVADRLGVALAEYEERVFEDSECKLRSRVNVQHRDVYVLHSLHGDSGQSPHDKLCHLLFFIGALKDAAARRVTAVVPYLCYARKDRRTKANDPVTTRYVAQMFEAVGTDGVVTLDVHNLQAYQNAFRCRTEHLEAIPLFAQHFCADADGAALTVVAPDSGAVKRARTLQELLEQHSGQPVQLAFMEKKRSSGVVSGAEEVFGEVSGRQVIIFDDLIASGTTIGRAARACRRQGATAVQVAATHGLFTAEAPDLLADPVFTRLVITDSVAPRLTGVAAQKQVILDSTPLIADAIRRLT